jgi:hypothetical protein
MSILDYLYSRIDITPLNREEHDIFWGEVTGCKSCGHQYIIAADEADVYDAACGYCHYKNKHIIISLIPKRNLQAMIQGRKPWEWPRL